MLTGSCLCGDITFEVVGRLDMVGHCHCSMCRKFHGSAFATFGTVAREDFRWVRGDDRVRTYRSSTQRNRHFCPRCGSAVPTTQTNRLRSCPWATSPRIPARARACIPSPVPWHLGTTSPTIFLSIRPMRGN